jgi:hypothetical protein
MFSFWVDPEPRNERVIGLQVRLDDLLPLLVLLKSVRRLLMGMAMGFGVIV